TEARSKDHDALNDANVSFMLKLHNLESSGGDNSHRDCLWLIKDEIKWPSNIKGYENIYELLETMDRIGIDDLGSIEGLPLARFHGVPAEERLHWRSFLVKLGADNLKGAKNEELLVASHKSVYIVYTVLGNICIYVVGKDEYEELALAEVIFAITTSVKDACSSKIPTERIFLEKYGKICLCLDEIVWM
ncbi:hypothetical protein KI387_002711, partial [Taxus chinensis]